MSTVYQWKALGIHDSRNNRTEQEQRYHRICIDFSSAAGIGMCDVRGERSLGLSDRVSPEA